MNITAVLITALTSILTCGGTSTIILYVMKKHDKTKALDRLALNQAEGINALAKAMLDLTNALHAKGIINGESEKVREDLEDYLFKCTADRMYDNE